MNIVFVRFSLKPIFPQALSNSASIRSACSMFGVISTMSSPIFPQALSNSASIRSACSMFGVISTMSSAKRR
ncbi:hypothetical protein V3C99_000259 [Haemonchus contortus]